MVGALILCSLEWVAACSLLGFVMEALLGLISCDYWVVLLWREKPRVLSNFCGIGLINAYTCTFR